MKIIATPCKGRDLKPGDLFSASGQDTWDVLATDPLAIGQRVYIRTDAPAEYAEDEEMIVYRITIEKAIEKERER